MFVLVMMTSCAPTTASTIEHCLRLKLNPPPPPSAHGAQSYHMAFNLSRIVCRDIFRAIGYSMRSTGKLPLNYFGALCNIFGDNEDKVEHYIKGRFNPRYFDKLIDGRSCATIRKKQHPMPPSSLSRLF